MYGDLKVERYKKVQVHKSIGKKSVGKKVQVHKSVGKKSVGTQKHRYTKAQAHKSAESHKHRVIQHKVTDS